jgi:hypothetical protein
VVVGGVALGYPSGQTLTQGRPAGEVLVVGGHDHSPGVEVAVVGVDGEAVAVRAEAADGGVFAQWGLAAECGQPRHHLRAAGVGVAGLLAEQGVHPAGGVEPERVPPLGAPGVADLIPLQHDVVDAAFGERRAGRQPGRAGPDHHTVE